MRWTPIVLLMSGLTVASAPGPWLSPVNAQQPLQAATPAGSGKRQVHHVMAPPKSAMLQGVAARSTAQTMAAHTETPLTQMPSFSMTGLDGKPADLSSLRSGGHWLLLYRPEHCGPCDSVMKALAGSESPLFKQGASYVIVVRRNGGTDSSGMLAGLKASYPTLANATWVEDAGGAGFAALKPHGEPALYAVSGNDIGWVLHGTLDSPAKLEGLSSAWLASTSEPPSAAAHSSKSATVRKAPPAATNPAPAVSQ